MVNRILRDDPSKSDMHNRQGITLNLMWKAMKDYDMWVFHETNDKQKLLTSSQVAYLLVGPHIWHCKTSPFNDYEPKVM